MTPNSSDFPMPLGTLDILDETETIAADPADAREEEETDLALASGEVTAAELQAVADDPRPAEDDDEDETPVKGPLALYLKEINAFPLLTETLEKKLADLRDASTASVVTMAGIVAPHAAAGLREHGPLAERLRRELDAIKRALVDRYSRIHEEKDGPAPTDPQRVLGLLAAKAQTKKNPLAVREPPADDAAFVADLFGLMKGLPCLCNRVCTSEIPHVPALVASLRDAFKRMQAAFPPGHPCGKALLAERTRLREQIRSDDETREYLDALLREGKIQTIDETTAAEALTRANLRLVVSVARGYTGSSLQDRIQEGNMGLMRAVEGYESVHGVKFSTYGSYWIKQSIKRSLVNTEKTVRVPAYMIELMAKWREAAKALKEELKREPSTEEIRVKLGLNEKKTMLLKRAVNLKDARAGEGADQEESVIDWAEGRERDASDRTETSEDLAFLFDHLDRLEARERTVLSLRFGLYDGQTYTLKQIGERLGITRERVRQIEAEALGKLERAASAMNEARKPRGRQRDPERTAAIREGYRLSEPDRRRIRYKLRMIELLTELPRERGDALLAQEGVTRTTLGVWKRQRLRMQEALSRHRALVGGLEEEPPIVITLPPEPVIETATGIPPAETSVTPPEPTIVITAAALPPPGTNGVHPAPIRREPPPPPPPVTFQDMVRQAEEGKGGGIFLVRGELMLRLDGNAAGRLLNFLTGLQDDRGGVADRTMRLRDYFQRNGFRVPEDSVANAARHLDTLVGYLRDWISHQHSDEDEDSGGRYYRGRRQHELWNRQGRAS